MVESPRELGREIEPVAQLTESLHKSERGVELVGVEDPPSQ